ncbi:sulfate transporter CysZ, partial [Pseudomonadota bacterium]
MNPFIGPIYAIKGFNLIRRPGLRRFVLIPLLVNILLFSAAIWLSTAYFDAYMAQVIPQGYEWLEWLLWPLFAVALMLTMFYTFTLIANFICAPFNGLLAEAVERELTGKTQSQETTMTQVIKETPATLWNEVKKLGYFLSRAIPLLILFFIPVINIIAPFLWIAFSASLLSKEYLDYPMANRGIEFKEQREILKGYRVNSLSFGGCILLLTIIPIVNFIVMPLAVAGAT